MARQPADDERFLVPACSVPRGERIWLKELARYLCQRPHEVYKYARRQGFIRWTRQLRGTSAHAYATPYAAMRIIAHFRAFQGGHYLAGKPILETWAKQLAQKHRELARKREQKAQAALAAANVSHLSAVAHPKMLESGPDGDG